MPTLAEIFLELGLDLRGVSSDVDMLQMLDDQPDVFFVDADFLERDPLHLVNTLRMLVPEAVICVYTGERRPEWAEACHFAGATAIFSKNANRYEIVSGMREALRRRPYTDIRLRGDG
ncbi:MAG: hypothetical protein WA814_09535 [Candidatus Baltobacteraceae bacterium]